MRTGVWALVFRPTTVASAHKEMSVECPYLLSTSLKTSIFMQCSVLASKKQSLLPTPNAFPSWDQQYLNSLFQKSAFAYIFFLTEVSLEWFSQNEGSLSLRFSDSLSELTTAYGPPGQNVDFSILLIKISVNLGSVLYSIPRKTFPEVPHKETWVPSIQHILSVPENSGLILWKKEAFFWVWVAEAF